MNPNILLVAVSSLLAMDAVFATDPIDAAVIEASAEQGRKVLGGKLFDDTAEDATQSTAKAPDFSKITKPKGTAASASALKEIPIILPNKHGDPFKTNSYRGCINDEINFHVSDHIGEPISANYSVNLGEFELIDKDNGRLGLPTGTTLCPTVPQSPYLLSVTLENDPIAYTANIVLKPAYRIKVSINCVSDQGIDFSAQEVLDLNQSLEISQASCDKLYQPKQQQ
jgi:hypothetical protein